MNFYGLWISKTSQEKIDECIETGVWKKESYPNEENREYERKKISEVGLGSKVFLFHGVGTVAIKDTEFSHFLSSSIYDHDKTIAKVKCPAVGIVKSKNAEDVSLTVEWDKDYISTEWYIYYRKDGVWRLGQANKKDVASELYEVIFNHRALDYKWWTEKLDWDRKKIKRIDTEGEFKKWLENNVASKAPMSSYPIALKNHIPEQLRKMNESRYDNFFDCQDIEYLETIYERLLDGGDLHKFNIDMQSRVPSAALRKYIEFLSDRHLFDRDIEKNEFLNTKKNFLNQILYGPPGTGKTYHTINKSLQIIDGDVPSNREESKVRFEALKKAGQIEFITFHQSYGYEEFVEGIKADVESDDIRYSIEEGIFQKLSRRAEKNYNKSVSTHENKKEFEVVFKEKILDRLNEDKLKIDTPKKYFYITDVTDRTIFFEKASGNTAHTLSLKSLKKMYELGKNDFLLGGLAVYYQPILELLLEDAVEEKEPEVLKNYILIIDEINRGNISKIFGELITLIEESKRLGNDEAMEITLPYSGEKFGVPKNLYIIGTMNTADRSIALMDTALRRRFEFEEMMPKPELLGKVEGIDLKPFLAKINQRIEYLYDRDHTIGHAYFMNVEDKETLDSVMKNKVIPLLQEYFYDDWEKIALVLNDGFIVKAIQDTRELFDNMDDEYIDEDKYSYSIASDFSIDSYRKIYGKIEQVQEGE